MEANENLFMPNYMLKPTATVSTSETPDEGTAHGCDTASAQHDGGSDGLTHSARDIETAEEPSPPKTQSSDNHASNSGENNAEPQPEGQKGLSGDEKSSSQMGLVKQMGPKFFRFCLMVMYKCLVEEIENNTNINSLKDIDELLVRAAKQRGKITITRIKKGGDANTEDSAKPAESDDVPVFDREQTQDGEKCVNIASLYSELPAHWRRYLFICLKISNTLPEESAKATRKLYISRTLTNYFNEDLDDESDDDSDADGHDEDSSQCEKVDDDFVDPKAVEFDSTFEYSKSEVLQPLEMVRPGFSHLPLAMFQDLPRKQITQRMCTKIEHADAMFTGSYNLLGILAKQIGESALAEACFEHVLSADEDNLNALAEMIQFFKERGDHERANTFKEKLDKLFKMMKGEVEDPDKVGFTAGAICLADQALVMGNEVFYNEDDNHRKYETTVHLYKAALKLAEKSGDFSLDEKSSWHFQIGTTLHKMSQIEYDKRWKPNLDMYDDSIKAFYYVSQCSSDSQYRAKAWGLIGALFSKAPRGYRPRCLKDYGLERFFEHPEACYKKAVDLCPRDVEIRTRYARYVARHVDLWKALRILNSFVKKPYMNYFWFGLVSRANVYIKLYKEAFKNREPPNIKYLENAKQDILDSLQLQHVGKEYIALAEVCEMMSKHRRRPGSPDLDLIREAVESYKKGFDAPDQKTYPLYVYDNFTRDLLILGEKAQAVSYLKEAVTNTGSQRTWRKLVNLMFELGAESKAEEDLKQLAYWINFGVSNFKDRGVAGSMDGWSCNHPTVMVDVCHRLHADGCACAAQMCAQSLEIHGFADYVADLKLGSEESAVAAAPSVEDGYFS